MGIEKMRKPTELDIREGSLTQENLKESARNVIVNFSLSTDQIGEVNQNKEPLKQIRETDKSTKEPGESQVKVSETTEIYDLGEAENDHLFSSPKARMEEITPMTDNQVFQQQTLGINSEAELSTPRNK